MKPGLIWTIPLALALLGAAPVDPPGRPAGKREQVRTVQIRATDDMRFSVTVLTAKPGERLRVVLIAVGTMPKANMAHNFVLLARDVDVDAFINASALARDSAYIAPAFRRAVLAATALIGNGETAEVSFTAPTVPGQYPFVCSFPGHYAAGMRGVLMVR